VPCFTINLNDAPEDHLGRLFEIMQIMARLNDDSDEIAITIKLPADELPQIATSRADNTGHAIHTHADPAEITSVNAGSVRDSAVFARPEFLGVRTGRRWYKAIDDPQVLRRLIDVKLPAQTLIGGEGLDGVTDPLAAPDPPVRII
jgi:hypothetical protein